MAITLNIHPQNHFFFGLPTQCMAPTDFFRGESNDPHSIQCRFFIISSTFFSFFPSGRTVFTKTATKYTILVHGAVLFPVLIYLFIKVSHPVLAEIHNDRHGGMASSNMVHTGTYIEHKKNLR